MDCPLPVNEEAHISLNHGSGGLATTQLIESLFYRAFHNDILNQKTDSALFSFPEIAHNHELAMTTDSYVINPIIFAGGDIGKLSVCGTLNDLAMVGATPKYLSASFILEEGLPLDILKRIVTSMAVEADLNQVKIVTGDTKVVERGAADQIYINTTGIGLKQHAHVIAPQSICAGDKIILTGDLGRHGMAVMCQREGLEFESQIQSDVASLYPAVAALLTEGVQIHCMRDLTRGGLGTVLNELSLASGYHLNIEESSLPISQEVKAATELLGLDPLYVANEGCCLIFVPDCHTKHTVSLLQKIEVTAQARCIGTVLGTANHPQVTLTSLYGAERILPHLSGIQLPRIC